MGEDVRSTRGRFGLIGAAAVLGATALAGTACGPQDGADDRAGGKPDRPDSEDVSRPPGWHPWQTSFTGGDRDASPSEGEENTCTTADADASRLRCTGTGFRGELLDTRDGSHRPHQRTGSHGDFAHTDGLVLTSDPDGWSGRIRALDERTGEERWHHKAAGAVLTADGVVTSEQTAQHWKPGQDHDEEPPSTDPGGDLITRDPKSGAERWRAHTPKDAWCSPLDAGKRALVACTDEETATQPVTLYRLTDGDAPDERRLHRLATVHAGTHQGGAQPQLLGTDRGALVFLPTGEKPAWNGGTQRYRTLLRVDTRTGEKTTARLPDDLPTGHRAHLAGGDLHFRKKSGGKTQLIAVDARTGKERWRTKTALRQLSAPEASTKLGELYFADHAGRVLALDRATGAERWRISTPRAEDGGTDTRELGAPSSVSRARDILVVSAGNTVYTADPSSPDKKPTHHTANLNNNS